MTGFWPGSSFSPASRKKTLATILNDFRYSHIEQSIRAGRGGELTAIDGLTDHILDLARVLQLHRLRLEHGGRDIRMTIHGLLEGIIFPAKDVIRMVREARRVATRPDEGLISISEVRGVDVVERARVPDGLQQDLRQTHGVRGGARTARLEGSGLRVSDVVLVVGRVQVLAVPAGGETVVGHDAVGARLRREVDGLGSPGAGVFHAGVGKLAPLP